MPNNKVKTSKALQGKKGAKSNTLHPKSRRAKQVARVGLRDDKIRSGKKDRREAKSAKVEKLLFFAEGLTDSNTCLTLDDMHELAQFYVARFDEELEEEMSARRAGRSKSLQHERLEQSRLEAEREYREGLLVPDLTTEAGIVLMRHFAEKVDGDPQFIPRLRLLRINSEDLTASHLVQPGASVASVQSAGDAWEDEMESESAAA